MLDQKLQEVGLLVILGVSANRCTWAAVHLTVRTQAANSSKTNWNVLVIYPKFLIMNRKNAGEASHISSPCVWSRLTCALTGSLSVSGNHWVVTLDAAVVMFYVWFWIILLLWRRSIHPLADSGRAKPLPILFKLGPYEFGKFRKLSESTSLALYIHFVSWLRYSVLMQTRGDINNECF